MKKYSQIFYGGAFGILLLLILSACQPQVVEVEVTRVVTETIEEEPVEAVEDGRGGIEATGSEEDGGSPFIPTAGQIVKVAPTRVATAGWVDMDTVTENEVMMRLIEESQEEVVVVHQYNASYGRSTLLVAGDRLIFVQSAAGLPSIPATESTTPPDLTTALINTVPTESLAELSVQLRCDRCETGGTGETVVILWPSSGITMTIDQGENVEAISSLLSLLRQNHNQIRQQTTLRAFRLGEVDYR